MMRNPILFLCGVVLVTVSACTKEAPQAAPPPPEVMVTEPLQRDVPVSMELVGQAVGFQDVEIRARVEGFLDSMSFTEGSLVTKGQLLYQIDPKPLKAAEANAKANLAMWQARLEKTNNDVARLTPLAKQQAVSQQELDNAVAQKDAAVAQVDAQKAALEKAQFDLGYTAITSPIDGLIGTTKVKTGNLVGRGESTLLVTISQIDPILFRVGIAEAEYLKVARRAQAQKESGAARGEPVPIQLILADGTVHPQTGRLDADGERLRVGDLHLVADLQADDVLRILDLDAQFAAVLGREADRRHLCINGRDRHRRRQLTGKRAARRRAFTSGQAHRLWGRRLLARLLNRVDHRLVVPEVDLVADLKLGEALHLRPREHGLDGAVVVLEGDEPAGGVDGLDDGRAVEHRRLADGLLGESGGRHEDHRGGQNGCESLHLLRSLLDARPTEPDRTCIRPGRIANVVTLPQTARRRLHGAGCGGADEPRQLAWWRWAMPAPSPRAATTASPRRSGCRGRGRT
jgi:RND family efflux transporter MFP subunit